MNTKWLLFIILALGIMACSETKKPAPDFTITLQPPVRDLRVTDTASVKIVVNRSDGFAEPVTITLEGETAGLEIEPLTIPASEGTLKFRVTDAAKIGTSFPVVKAAAGSSRRTETLTLRIQKAVANLTEVTIKDNGGSKQVRQGFGTLTLEVTGSNLERAAAFTLGDLTLTVLAGRTASRLELQTTVAHGASLGAKDLILTAEGGDTVLAGAVMVTPITSGPGGNDVSGTGTSEKPFRSLKQALSQAQAGDTVKLLNGTYTEASGETWSRATLEAVSTNLTPGVKVEGESTSGVILEGPGRGLEPPSYGLVPADGTVISKLTLTGFGFAVALRDGKTELNNVTARNNDAGFYTLGGELKSTAGETTANYIGVVVMNDAKAILQDSSSHANENDGIWVMGTSSLELTNVALYNNLQGLFATGSAKVMINGSDIRQNKSYGVHFQGTELVMRGSKIHKNAANVGTNPAGLYVQLEPDKVDLGTFLEAGNNQLFDNNGNQLLDARPNSANLEAIKFTLSATTLNGQSMTPDVYVGTFFNAPFFSMIGGRNVIQFFR